MRFRRLLQFLPALLAALFLLAGANGTRPVLGPAPQMYLPVTCVPYTLVTDGQATFSFAAGGISQPLPPYAIVSACSLHVEGTGWAHLDVNLRSWDPTALAPDPTTVSLRTSTLDPSDLLYYTQNRMQLTAFSPPVITRAVTGVAEAPLPSTAIEATHPADFFGYPFVGYFDPASTEAGLPAANAVAPDGSHAPLAGAHPVIAQALCAGDASLQDLRLGQCVNRTDDTLVSRVFQIVQRFRVPAALIAVDRAGGRADPFAVVPECWHGRDPRRRGRRHAGDHASGPVRPGQLPVRHRRVAEVGRRRGLGSHAAAAAEPRLLPARGSQHGGAAGRARLRRELVDAHAHRHREPDLPVRHP
jgi:hypothetical protein